MYSLPIEYKEMCAITALICPAALMRTFQSAILKWTYVDIEPFLQSILWALSAEESISWILQTAWYVPLFPAASQSISPFCFASPWLYSVDA